MCSDAEQRLPEFLQAVKPVMLCADLAVSVMPHFTAISSQIIFHMSMMIMTSLIAKPIQSA